MKGYWVLFTHYECVLCSDSYTYRSRVFDRPRPKKWNERHEIVEVACVGHFL